ncbi:GntR family transcriptional regulator [Ligilactobacillus agilis]|uniref:Transcription regulator n=2 Tax=Ligilactobacillus agilis TaxID=1601 RepID=A0A0R2AI48_9LACO|nr:GntR family transcriptional regulator [Ligilactobacillus agilis]KRM66474.1 transcription regulator [Ligilactobacillus agilis DSM 20509]MBL1055101.1 GntR family transcriptional regulator [Ligilactobacillus agilis]MDO4598550.1 GntR family transcriptional regulator [Ligilactobacillus agilis]GET11880.1 GntR family transcriptional regulator [Ligilactobacillus agilis]
MLKYQKVANDLAQKIEAKVYPERLPKEEELIAAYGVSRNTIRSALDILTNQGIIRRIQGSGYFVSFHPDRLNNVINMSNKYGLRDLGVETPIISKVLTLEVIPATKRTADFLQCRPGTPLYHVLRLRYKNNELISLEDAYYLKDVVPYLDEKICQKAIYAFIIEHYNLEIISGDEYSQVHVLSEQEASLTGLPAGTPAMCIEEVDYLKNEQPFNYSKTLYLKPKLTFYYHVRNHLH